MRIQKKDYRCMHGYDEDVEYISAVESTHGHTYGFVYRREVVVFRHGSDMEVNHTQIQKRFGKISEQSSKNAREWCKKWLPLVHKYCTHKDNEYKKNGYGMSIEVAPHGYCYYSIIKFSEKESPDIYPAVTAYLYKSVRTYLGFINIGQEINEEVLKKCNEDALKEWELITGTN